MSENFKSFKFEKPPKKLTYTEKESFKLTKDLQFYHNKSKIKNLLSPLQDLFKIHVGAPLMVTAIRDSYLDAGFSEKYLTVLFSTFEFAQKANDIVEPLNNINIETSCYHIEIDTNYLILLAKDTKGISSGCKMLEDLIKQSFDDYFENKKFDQYITMPTMKLYNCGL